MRALVESHFSPEEIQASGIWLRVCMVLLDPAQRSGWKLHLSATPASYADLLNAALPLLAKARVPFKLLNSLDEVERMAGGERGLMQTGKCVTIYPPHEEHAAKLAASLASALRGIPGPAIPTDIPYCADAPVYFRFGPYDGRMEIDAMGQERRLLWRPDLGHDTWDITSGGTVEMPARACLPNAPAPDHLAFLRTRFDLTQLLQLTAKGGVLIARERGGAGATPLLIKTARPHTNSDSHGRDAIWALHREHALLLKLQGILGIPDAGELVTSDAASAIVRPFIEGKTFWELWTTPNARAAESRAVLGRALEEIRATVHELHAQGIIVRDISPGNILIAPARAYLMDFELAHVVGDPAAPYRRGTSGFFDPNKPIGAPPTPEDDDYALEALTRMIAPLPVPATVPSDRSLAPKNTPEVLLGQAVADCLAEPASQSSWNFYNGLTGLILTAYDFDLAPNAIGITPNHTAELLQAAESVLHIPGYHFGASGYAVAAGLLGFEDDAELILRRVAESKSSVPDICQGIAGYLLACAELFEHTGRPAFRNLAEDARKRLLSLAHSDDAALLWRWPEGPFGDLSGAACFGFGHGLAGILYALLRAETIAPASDARDHIQRGLITLLRCAEVVPGTRDALWWPVSSNDATCWNAWCHGTPGVLKALAAAARAGMVDAPLLHAALRGMYLANNSELCLCHGVASRLDAFNDCMAIPSFIPPDVGLQNARHDFDTLSQFQGGFEAAHSLMTGLPGVLRTLHRARAWR